MKQAVALAFVVLFPATARAEIDLVRVPALCGTFAEVLGVLDAKMPDPEEIGRGTDNGGAPIATLLAGNGYWALLATMSGDRVCVVASGYNWAVAQQPAAF